MEKIEYSDLNKFLVSIGVVLMSISILILWLFFREPFDLLLKQETIEKLTETAKPIIIKRQSQVSDLLSVLPYLAIVLFLLGLTSLIIGLVRWFKKQILLDERDELTNKKLQKELEKLSEKEVVKKAETEFKLTIGEQIQPTLIEKEISVKNTFIESYLKIEKVLSDKLKTFFAEKYKVLINYRLNSFEYDIILTTPRRFELDKIIEIKYYPNRVTTQNIRETLIRMDVANRLYQGTMKKPVKSVLIVVIPEIKYNIFEIAKLKETKNQLNLVVLENLTLHFIKENELINLTKEVLSVILEE